MELEGSSEGVDEGGEVLVVAKGQGKGVLQVRVLLRLSTQWRTALEVIKYDRCKLP